MKILLIIIVFLLIVIAWLLFRILDFFERREKDNIERIGDHFYDTYEGFYVISHLLKTPEKEIEDLKKDARRESVVNRGKKRYHLDQIGKDVNSRTEKKDSKK